MFFELACQQVFILTYYLKYSFMRKLIISLIFILAMGLLLSACNKKACPAYRSSVETAHTEMVS